MKIEQIYTNCLAQGAYYIESAGEAVVIDPLREVQPYIDRAEKDGASIKYILETHFHADFVSGHLTLSELTGAPIVFGPMGKPDFDAHVATDGEILNVGKVKIKVLHTPGHTMESTTYLLLDEQDNEVAAFTGDTLFLGDVGRPDLAQKAANMTQEQLAGTLYDSLREKIMVLPDEVTVYPGHGAGSACGKHMSKETVGTIGEQKKTNYALRADMTKEEFIKEVTDGLEPPPAYFPMNVALNKKGYAPIGDVISQGTRALSPREFEMLAESSEALILDVRHQSEFYKGFVPESIFIGLDGSFAPWVGAMIKDVNQPIILVTPEGREEETVTRLARVGFDNTLGYLKGGISAWEEAGYEVETIMSIPATEFKKDMNILSDNAFVFDVRKDSEYQSEHAFMARSTPLSHLNDYMAEFPTDELFYVHCAGGYRSMIAASILKARGYDNVIDIQGGFKAIKEADVPVTAFVCPSTLK